MAKEKSVNDICERCLRTRGYCECEKGFLEKSEEEFGTLSDWIQNELSGEKTLDVEEVKQFLEIIKNKDPIVLAGLFHSCYEAHAITAGWKTQESCRVKFDDLPEENKMVMLLTAKDIITALNADIDKHAGEKLNSKGGQNV